MERRLAAILAADLVGYSRLVRLDEEGTIEALKSLQTRDIAPRISARRGRIFKLMGDGMLAEFTSVVEAVHAAADIQVALNELNQVRPDHLKLELRIGINMGDVVIDGDDIQGDGVNIAARLEAIAGPGEICISGAVYDQIRDRTSLCFHDKGEQELKNIDRPLRVWCWTEDAEVSTQKISIHRRPELPLPTKPSVAVLPFDDLSSATDQQHLADGFVEAITAALSRVRSFFVIARNSAFTYKNRTVNVIEVGRELGVAYVLEGSIQRAGDRIRVTVQLIETGGGSHVWAERYDGVIDNLFELQDQITEQVAGALQPSIRIAEIERCRRKRPQDLGAYDYTMRALPHVWALEKEESAQALDLLNKALTLDPDYPLATSLAAWCHAQRSVYNWTEDISGSQVQALQLAERAAQQSSDDPLILAVLGAVHTFVRHYGTARVLLERAVALDPNAAWAWSRLGWLECYSDSPEQSRRAFERARRLSPLDPMNFNNLVGIGSAYDIEQNYEEAIRYFLRALEERPHASWIYRNLAPALVGAGRLDEAKSAFAVLMAKFPDLTAAKVRQAIVYSPAVVDRICQQLRTLGLPD
jgi:adenylate cyclase